MTFARFRSLGQYPSLVIALSKCRIALRSSCGSSYIMSVVIWSGPGALMGMEVLTAPLSSPIVNARSFSDDGAWIASFRIILGSGVSSWGLYTSVRWLANRLVFFGVALSPRAWRVCVCTDRWVRGPRLLSRFDRFPDGLVLTPE